MKTKAVSKSSSSPCQLVWREKKIIQAKQVNQTISPPSHPAVIPPPDEKGGVWQR